MMKQEDVEALKRDLSRLYADASKHSSYQSVPLFAANEIGYQVPIDHLWRSDQIRLEYIEAQFSSDQAETWIDFGANTGFFALSLAHEHPSRNVIAVEANPNHATFIDRIARSFRMQNVRVLQEAPGIDQLHLIPASDVLLHLNVLHHAGSDFDKGLVNSPGDFTKYAIEYLERLRSRTSTLILQLGSNLWGSKEHPLIDYQDDVGKLLLFRSLLRQSGWTIDHCAYARRTGNQVSYASLPQTVLHQDDPNALSAALSSFALSAHPGEFYRRPMFICRHAGA